MNTTAIIALAIVACIGMITVLNKQFQTSRLRNNMNEITSQKNIYEMFIIKNCLYSDKELVSVYHEVYKQYQKYIYEWYSNIGEPNGRGDQSLYKISKRKGEHAFFIYTFYYYLSGFFSTPRRSMNEEERKLFEQHEQIIKTIYNTVCELR